MDDELVETLKEQARKIQKTDPDFWDSISTDRFDPPTGFIEQICWALKRYDLDDPELRDLPSSERLRIEREPGPEGFRRRRE
jgi:hypothetical protein